MHRILHETNSSSYKGFISGPENFRYAIDPEYKANRRDTVRPEWLQPIREHLVVQWNAHVSDGIEADDNLGIEQTEDTIICSIDKDLLQIPGKHYNFVSGDFKEIDTRTGWINFYTQLIMGDKSDNIPGYDLLMRQKVPQKLQWAIDALEQADSIRTMYEVVYDMYENAAGIDRFNMNCQLLYIQRKEGDSFRVPE